ncbi:MAG TPA: SDR family NAD(P)-dependent oxidoreductase [Vicinamibacterales bacterium]|nr:SDR family NAD(P)-dependent oxidoreductase [Vicinamibacterales bacterium]
MSWRGRRVMVTGAGGFIGSHLTERLLADGATVTAMVHYNALGTRGWLEGVEESSSCRIVAGDITDRDSVRAAMADAEVVFHLAALIAIPYSYRAPASYVRSNVEGTLNVLLAARELGVQRIVHTSTSEVYGTARYAPIDEEHPLQAQSPYAATKIGADKLVESFRLSFDVPSVIVRPFNTFGPRQSARAVIPTIISQCLARRPVRLGNLRPTRDLNYVANTVDGFLLAGEKAEALGRTINLGTGREIAIGDLAALIARLIGVPSDIQVDPERLRRDGSEVERLIASSAVAEQVLGWRPAVTLEEGLRRTIDWVAANEQHFRPHEHVL